MRPRIDGASSPRTAWEPGRGRNPLWLPSIAELLTTGGDARIARDPVFGANKYGCLPAPDPAILAYGSSTASTISSAGYRAAERLRSRLQHAAGRQRATAIYATELTRIRVELLQLCGLDLPGLDIVLGASGTDLHLFAAHLAAASTSSALRVVTVEPAETGTGVPAALAGRHFNTCTALGGPAVPNAPVAGSAPIEVAVVALRAADGSPRPASAVDAEVEALVASAVAAGRRVLLTVTDVSKTGLIGPSIDCALALQRRFPEALDILVDACQFRVAFSTIRAYVANGFWVAATGSKFVTGPAFSGALLVPESAASRLRQLPLAPALRAYSARADWPWGWAARAALDEVPNFGLLLRWEAALAELRVFASLPEDEVATFIETFAAIVDRRLESDPAFEPLPVPPLDRGSLVPSGSWDRIRTIFPFLLRARRRGGAAAPLGREATAQIYRWLEWDLGDHPDFRHDELARVTAARRCQLGQPVACGTREGIPVSALRICNSMRLVNDAVSPEGRGAAAVITDALAVLDKAAWLAEQEAE